MSSEVFAGPKETPPQGPPPKPFHLPATTDFTLPNGMQVTIVPYGTVPKVAVRLLVGAGAIHESAGQVWLSKLNAALMKEGTGTLGLRNGIAKFICGVDPEANRIECVAESGFLRDTMGRATRKFRHLGDERLVLFAPVDDNFVLDHFPSPSLAFKITARTCLT